MQSVAMECGNSEWSCNDGGDSNALILPCKKNKKRKGHALGSQNVKKVKAPTLSKSQQRKLKKIEEEKRQAELLSKSMEALEKYKIQETELSLLQSSQNIGRAETKREKRSKAVQFYKAGLRAPDDPDRRSSFDDEEPSGSPSSDDEEPSGTERAYSNTNQKSEEHIVDENKVHQVKMYVPVLATDVANNDEDAHSRIEELPNLCPPDFGENTKQQGGLDESPDGEVNGSSCMTQVAACGLLTTPTVVAVVRPKDIEDKRKDLPIVMMEQEIMEAINYNSTVIICGETGCGKTTQLPQFLYEAGFGSNLSNVRRGIIGVTQPRRVAVLATAKRVAYELGLRFGKEVGFQVRYDKKIGDNSFIKFMTDGILLREVQNDFLLRRYSVIILDEAHERSLNTDILIGMLSRVIKLRQELFEKQQKMLLEGQNVSADTMIYPLKIVLMSATLRVEDFISGKRLFPNPPPVIEVPARQYPVTIHFSKRTEIVDYVGQAYKKVISIHKKLPPGGILVFVTGQREVEYLCGKLRKASKEIVQRAKVVDDKANELNTDAEMNSVEEVDMNEIDEAYGTGKNQGHNQTDRFSSYDEDEGDFVDDEESDESSFDSESESDWETVTDGVNPVEEKTSSVDNDPLSKDALSSLKAAFEALAEKPSPNPNPERTTSDIVSSQGELNPKMEKKAGEKDKVVGPGPMHVLPLYAMLPAAAQLCVFDKVKEGERLVVVATNVAETSLTIPGIKYVVDTGREKVKNYNTATGMETYDIQWISKASAAQRAGRSGRTGPGHCYRLYSSAVFHNIFPGFSLAEISKIPVDGVVLLMKSMGIDKVANFPFPTPPEAKPLREAEQCLKVLEALDSAGKLTPLGKAMAHYPMSPRHSRMLLTVIHMMMKTVANYPRANLILGFTVAAAAALSLSNPFIFQFQGNESDDKKIDKQEKRMKKKLREDAKVSRAKFQNPTSDALTVSYALQCFEQSEDQAQFCTENALHLKTMEEMSKLRKQLLQLIFNQSIGAGTEFSWNHGSVADVEIAWGVHSTKHPLQLKEEQLLGQAICAGWADRVAKRVRVVSRSSSQVADDIKARAGRYQATMVDEPVFLHRYSSLSSSAPEFLVYSELVQTNRPYMHGATTVKPDWLVKYATSLCTFSAPLSDPKPYYDSTSDRVMCWVVPTFGPHLWELPLHSVPIPDLTDRVTVFGYALLQGQVLPCLGTVRSLMVAPPSSVLRPEAMGQKRVGNLVYKLKARKIDCCGRLRSVWEENPMECRLEIRDWFQEAFGDHRFEKLWVQMQAEVKLGTKERFPKRDRKM